MRRFFKDNLFDYQLTRLRAIEAKAEVTEGFTPDARFTRKPVYAVLFSSDVDENTEYLPIVSRVASADITVPHGLDRDVVAALPGLWYCVHLPNDLLQLIDIPAATLKRSQLQHLDHEIILAPIGIFDEDHLVQLREWLETRHPTLVVCPDNLAAEASARSDSLGFALPVAKYSELSSESLRGHWQAIHQRLVPEAPYLGRVPALSHRFDLATTELPKTWLARQMGRESSTDADLDDDQNQLVGEALWHQVLLSAIARLENENTSLEVAEEQLPETIGEEMNRVRVPVVLALPGVASSYSRKAYDRTLLPRIRSMLATDEADTWSTDIADRTDVLVERSAIEFITAHRAIARTGIGMMFPSVPQEAFIILGQLERHFHSRPNGPKVWSMLNRLDDTASSIWIENTASVVARASMLTVFSNFPIGLLRLPGDSEPLSTRIPITYRPILPLTRAVQRELMYMPPIEIPADFRVLVAECIPDSDPVGRASRRGWRTTQQLINATGQPISVKLVETLSLASLRAAIADEQADFLVISAHGAFDRSSNVAGLVIGSEFSIGPELGEMPTVVILSACNVAPRGTSAVSIADLLLREGAVAVLGTQVPVDVFHNATLMSRFFLYIRETIAEREDYSNLLEIWHYVQTSNAVVDILNGSESLRSWGYGTAPSGVPVLEEFMSVRSVDRLRNVYADTETVLGEIADDQGIGPRVRNWFHRPGYVPESLFYVFAGQPERIYIRPLAEAMRRFGRTPSRRIS